MKNWFPNRTLPLFMLLLFVLVHNHLNAQVVQQVIINEIHYNPDGGVPSNSFLVTAPCNDSYYAKEWIELYNPNPCQTVDVSCMIIGATLSNVTQPGIFACEDIDNNQVQLQNVGWFTIPQGTVIPPLGFLTIGGDRSDVMPDFPVSNYLPIGSTNYCGSARFFLNSRAGWLAMFTPDGRTVVDGAYWTVNNQNEYQTDENFGSPFDFQCGCNRPTVLRMPSGRELITRNQLRYIGNTRYTGQNDNSVPNYHHRTVDGGCWKMERGQGTSKKCNNGDCFPLPQKPFINTAGGNVVCTGRAFTLQTTYNPPEFDCPNNLAYRITYEWRSNGRVISTQRNFTGTAQLGALYTLTININGCTYVDTARVQVVNIPQPRFKVDQTLVCEKTEATLTYTGDNYDGAVIEWAFDGGTPATATGAGPHQVIWRTSGVKRVTVTIKIGDNCQNTYADLVPVTQAPRGQHVSNVSEICQGDPVIISVKDLALDAELYDWDFQGGIVEETPGKPNTYSVLWWDPGLKRITVKIRQPLNPCIGLPDTLNILVNPNPIADVTVYIPPHGVCDAVTVSYTGYAPEGSKFYWNFDQAELFEPVLKKVVPSVEGFGPHKIRWYEEGDKVISVYVIARGCTSNVFKTRIEYSPYYLNVAEMDIPNAFSPNGDGINDFYELQNLREECADYSMEIFTRWGDKVFEIPRNGRRWDGIIYGHPAPEGSYVYKLTIQVIGEEPRTRVGNITLVR